MTSMVIALLHYSSRLVDSMTVYFVGSKHSTLASMSQPIAVTSVPVDVTHRGVPSWTPSPSLQHRHLLHTLLYSPLSNAHATLLQFTTMTDLTSELSQLVLSKNGSSIPSPKDCKLYPSRRNVISTILQIVGESSINMISFSAGENEQ